MDPADTKQAAMEVAAEPELVANASLDLSAAPADGSGVSEQPLKQKEEKEEDNGNVKVAVRIRPLSTTELVDACEDVISFPAGNQLAIGGNTDKKPKSFSYDYVFPGHSGQEDIYTRCVSSQVQAFLSGYNATIFAYGQTGSGKTYTMGTASSVGLSREHVGIVPRVVADIFKKVEAKADTHDFEVKVVFLEIHNQSINDLLNPLAGNNSNKSAANSPNDQDEKRSHSHSDRNRSEGGPAIRELSNGEITVTGAVERVVASEEETLACLEQGTQCRCVCIYI
jgi:hypothetical protein